MVGYLHDEPAGANFIPSFASASPECNKAKGRQLTGGLPVGR